MKNIFFFSLLMLQVGFKQPTTTNLQTETVFTSKGVVWGFSFIDQEHLLVAHRSGKLTHYNIKTKKSNSIPIPQVWASGQGGLLDVHFYPSGRTKYIYITFALEKGGKVSTALARGVFDKGTVKNFKTLFVSTTDSNTPYHFGSRLLFKDNSLFMTIGDRGKRELAQNPNYHNGKILRLNLDGSPHRDNPYFANKKGLAEIWSLGHRNPQGISANPKTGEVLSCEFGPKGGDELNLIRRGKNYGWPIITYGTEYHGPKIGTTQQKGMEQPITYWVPSISPSGMDYYTGNKIPSWKGDLFLANLSSRHLRRLRLVNNKVTQQEALFKDLNERIRHVRSGPDGYLYFSTDSGKIYRILSSKQ